MHDCGLYNLENIIVSATIHTDHDPLVICAGIAIDHSACMHPIYLCSVAVAIAMHNIFCLHKSFVLIKDLYIATYK